MSVELERYLRLSEIIESRSPKTRLMVVSKTQSEARIREFLEGLDPQKRPPLGENYADELAAKAPGLADLKPEWHFIGVPQTRGLKKVVSLLSGVHTLTRVREFELLEKASCPFFIQVNISQEPSKSGLDVTEVEPFLELLFKHGRASALCQGFMGMAAPRSMVGDLQVRRSFQLLSNLRDRVLPAGGLCIGMSEDFEIALEFAPVFVRLGSSIFGERQEFRAT